MLKFCLAGLYLLPCGLAAQEFYADHLIDYQAGVGFAAGYTNGLVTLGEPSRSTPGPFGGPVDPFDPPYLPSQILSIGSNGSVTVQFPRPVVNDPQNLYGLDFLVFGNAGFIITNGDFSGGGVTDGGLFGYNPGLTRVSVSVDNASYFTLNPATAGTVDGLFPTDGAGNFGRPVNPNLTLSDFAGKDLAGIQSLYGGSGGGTGFDIGSARDSNDHPVFLSSISFVRIAVLSGHSEIDAFAAIPEPSAARLVLCALPLAAMAVSMQLGGKRLRSRFLGKRRPETPAYLADDL